MLQATLFDFNGVLVDDEPLHLAGFNAVLAQLDIVIDPAEYEEKYLGFDDRGAFQAMLHDRGRPVDPRLVERLIHSKGEVYARLAATGLKVFPGAADIVRRAAAVGPVGIVSGALRAEILGALRLLGVGDCVRAIVAAEDVGACKPDPEGYTAGLRALGVSVASRAVAVEDSIAGVIAAKSAGARVLAVAHTYAAEPLWAAGADMVMETLAEVRADDLEALAARA